MPACTIKIFMLNCHKLCKAIQTHCVCYFISAFNLKSPLKLNDFYLAFLAVLRVLKTGPI